MTAPDTRCTCPQDAAATGRHAGACPYLLAARRYWLRRCARLAAAQLDIDLNAHDVVGVDDALDHHLRTASDALNRALHRAGELRDGMPPRRERP